MLGSPTPSSPSAPQTEPTQQSGRSNLVRTIRLVLWLLCAVLILFAARVGRENLSFWRDLHRWEREPSVTLTLDLADPAGMTRASWDQDCSVVCKQGLWLRLGPGVSRESLAGLSGTLVLKTTEDGEEQWSWSIDGEGPADDPEIHLLSVTPPPNGPAEIRVLVNAHPLETAAGTLEFEFWPELCGIERMSATVTSALAIGAALMGAVLGLALLITWSPGRGHAPVSDAV